MIEKYDLERTYFCTISGISWSLNAALKILVLSDLKLKESSGLNIESIPNENDTLKRQILIDLLDLVLNKYSNDLSKIVNYGKKGKCLSEQMKILVTLLEEEKYLVECSLSLIDS